MVRYNLTIAFYNAYMLIGLKTPSGMGQKKRLALLPIFDPQTVCRTETPAAQATSFAVFPGFRSLTFVQKISCRIRKSQPLRTSCSFFLERVLEAQVIRICVLMYLPCIV